jgi:hypothetical protein
MLSPWTPVLNTIGHVNTCWLRWTQDLSAVSTSGKASMRIP